MDPSVMSRRLVLGVPVVVAVGFGAAVPPASAWAVWAELRCREDLVAVGAFCRATSAGLRALDLPALEARLGWLGRVPAGRGCAALGRAVRADHAAGQVEDVGLWRLSRLEVELAVLAALCFGGEEAV